MTRFRPLGHGPIEVVADLRSRSDHWQSVRAILFPRSVSDEKVHATFGREVASWMCVYSPHIGEFTSSHFLETARQVHIQGPFKWATSTKGFAAARGEQGAVLVPDGEFDVFVFSSPDARPRAFAAIMLQQSAPDDDDVLAVFESVVGPVAREMPAGAPARIVERWHTPSALSFFAALDDAWFEWSVEDGYVTCERVSS